MIDVLSAFSLSSAAGLNAYLPLLIVGLTARYTDLIVLSSPWNSLEHPAVLAVLAALLLIEMTVDKIPAVDTLNDTIQTFVRPVAGAILFASSNNVISHVSPELAIICGLLTAGGVHAVKATARPAVTATTLGMANPILSLGEDVLSALTTVMAIWLPALTALIIISCLVLFAWWYYRRRKRLEQTRTGEL